MYILNNSLLIRWEEIAFWKKSISASEILAYVFIFILAP